MSNKSVFGTILIGFGVLWLLDNFRVINAPSLWEWVPIILIAAGVWRLLSSQFKSIVDSVVFIGSGLTIGLLQLDIISFREIIRAFWPTIMILIGVFVLSSGGKKKIENENNDKEGNK